MKMEDIAAYDGGTIIDEAALLERLPISSRTARDWRKRGVLPYIKPGGKAIIYHWPTVERALLRLQKGGQ